MGQVSAPSALPWPRRGSPNALWALASKPCELLLMRETHMWL